MKNMNINELADIKNIESLFSSVDGLDDNNLFLIVLNRDYGTADGLGQGYSANAARVGAKNGGVVGGLVGSAVANSVSNTVNKAISEFNSKLNDKQRVVFDRRTFGGYLLNVTDKGMGVIPLSNNGKLIPSVKNFSTAIENYVYFDNSEIEEIKIEKLALHFSSKHLAVYFKGLDKVSTPWQVYKKHKLIPFAADSFKKLENKLNLKSTSI